ncbi:hypothetical protein TTRE_0000413501 [Trichuris trichiura]|uniref:DUF7107 domain-containing protein n=1 Tax=Trichuris trichiura TaxID=36087 RepID=A0A077Z6P5_TRITR|nr:hypothetical protein TTRE_0000413501 [Trichuris trichiura]
MAMCKRNSCYPAMPAGGYCINDVHCESEKGQACLSGLCMAPIDFTLPPSNLPQVQCTKHDHCIGQTMCVRQRCVAAFPTGVHCIMESQCQSGETCLHGDCWRPTRDMASLLCISHDQCPGSRVCWLGLCRAARRTNLLCMYDYQCANGACKDNVCHTTVDVNSGKIQCYMHDHCQGQQLCNDNKCIPAFPVKLECNSRNPCPGKSVCKHGTCFSIVRTSLMQLKSCATHEDCEGQQLCRLGSCVAAIPTGTPCNASAPCTAGRYCKYNTCFMYFPQ